MAQFTKFRTLWKWSPLWWIRGMAVPIFPVSEKETSRVQFTWPDIWIIFVLFRVLSKVGTSWCFIFMHFNQYGYYDLKFNLDRFWYMISLICVIQWTNWTDKENRDKLTDGEQMTATWGRLAGEGIEQKGERTHGHGQ